MRSIWRENRRIKRLGQALDVHHRRRLKKNK